MNWGEAEAMLLGSTVVDEVFGNREVTVRGLFRDETLRQFASAWEEASGSRTLWFPLQVAACALYTGMKKSEPPSGLRVPLKHMDPAALYWLASASAIALALEKHPDSRHTPSEWIDLASRQAPDVEHQFELKPPSDLSPQMDWLLRVVGEHAGEADSSRE